MTDMQAFVDLCDNWIANADRERAMGLDAPFNSPMESQCLAASDTFRQCARELAETLGLA